jgi:hypothetical protein
MSPSRRTASQADDDPNIDTRTMYSPDCTVVLSQASTILPAGSPVPVQCRQKSSKVELCV